MQTEKIIVKGGMKMNNLILMVGIPGSGKSTTAKEIVRMSDGAIKYVSRDNIRYDLLQPGDYYFSKEDLVFKYFIEEIRSELEEADVIADATHLNPQSREKVIRRVKDAAAAIKVIFVNVSLETALKRNDLRKGIERVPDNKILEMYSTFVPPRKLEGIADIFEVGEEGVKSWKEIYKFVTE